MPFLFGGIEAWLGFFLLEQPDTLQTQTLNTKIDILPLAAILVIGLQSDAPVA